MKISQLVLLVVSIFCPMINGAITDFYQMKIENDKNKCNLYLLGDAHFSRYYNFESDHEKSQRDAIISFFKKNINDSALIVEYLHAAQDSIANAWSEELKNLVLYQDYEEETDLFSVIYKTFARYEGVYNVDTHRMFLRYFLELQIHPKTH